MAALFQGIFYSERFQYRISIDDEDLVNATNYDFKTESDLFTLAYDGSTDERFSAVIPSKLTLGMYINTTAGEDFIEEMVDSRDGRYKLKVERYNKNALAYELFWVGTILTDQVNYEDASYPFVFQITAIDQLGILAGIPYNKNGIAYEGKQTFLEHIENILKKININYFHDLDDIFFQSVVNWYEDSQVHDLTNKVDPLDNTRIDHIAFYNEDEDGNKEFFDCLTILRQLATSMGSRIYQSKGIIRMEQPNERIGDDYYEFSYSKNFNLISKGLVNSNVTIGQNNNTQYAGGTFSFLPGLRYVRLNYNHKSNRNLLLSTVWNSSNNTTVQLGEVESDQTTSTFSFSANLYVKINNVTGTAANYRFQFFLRLLHGTKGLKRIISDNGFGTLTEEEMEWDTVSSNYMVTTQWMGTGGTFNIPINFETPVVPEALGDLSFNFLFNGIYKQGGTITSPPNLSLEFYELQDPILEFFSEGKPDINNTRIFQIDNNSFPNNTSKKELNTIIGDAITNVTLGKMEIYTGSEWQDSEAWSINQAGNSLTIMELMILETMAGQKKGIQKYDGSFKAPFFFFHSRLNYASIIYLMMQGSLNAATDTWSGTWFNINLDRSNLSFATAINQGGSSTTGNISGGGSNVGGGGSTGGGGTIASTFPQFFDNHTGGSLTGVLNALPSNASADQYMKLWRDGRLLRAGVDFTIDEVNNKIDLTIPAMGENFRLETFN